MNADRAYRNRASGVGLSAFVDATSRVDRICRQEVNLGDRVLVTTRNAVYSILAIENGYYLVSGGWFDRRGISPTRTAITGCTLGGSMINVDTLAACGLCLEFGNGVVTSRIKKIAIIRCSSAS